LRDTGDVVSRQEAWLRECLQRNRNSNYGRSYGFDRIRSADEFRDRVPLVSYEDLTPWIERIANGEASVLFEGLPGAFETTGGSAGGSKLIPYSEASLKDFRVAIMPWIADAVEIHGFAIGCAYWGISPATRQPQKTPGGIPVGLSDGAYLGKDVLSAFVELSAVPYWVGRIQSVHVWQLATLYWLLRRIDLELISVWSPTFFLILLDALPQCFAKLNELLENGGMLSEEELQPDAAALRRLGMYMRNKETRTLWPNLKLISCWADASSKPFFDDLRGRFPYAAFQGKGLLATEGVVTVPNRNGRPVLAADSGFYEFLDETGCSWLAHDLQNGERYEVVMTTSGGLYRYRMGDSVVCEGFTEDLPVLRFLGRNSLVSDILGEKLTEEFVASCLTNIPGFRMLVPSVSTKPKYVLVVDERTQIKTKSLAGLVEEFLSRNPQYAYARRMGQLDRLSVYLASNPLEAYIKRAVENEALMGDVKVPAIRRETDWLKTFSEPLS
jgi:hypothetical protein